MNNVYEDLIGRLKESKLYPSKVVQTELFGEDRVVALHVDCSPLQKHLKEPVIKSICGEGFVVYWIGNGGDYFFITAKTNDPQ